MNDEKYRESIRTAGEVAAEIDQQQALVGERSIRERLIRGLTVGTSDADQFASSYVEKLLAGANPNLR